MGTWFLVLCQNGGQLLVPNRWCQRHAQLACDPKWLGFVIYLGLRMYQFQKYCLLRENQLAVGIDGVYLAQVIDTSREFCANFFNLIYLCTCVVTKFEPFNGPRWDSLRGNKKSNKGRCFQFCSRETTAVQLQVYRDSYLYSTTCLCI